MADSRACKPAKFLNCGHREIHDIVALTILMFVDMLSDGRIACGADWSQRGTDTAVPFLPIPNLGLNVQVLINVWGKLLETRSKKFAVNALRILVDDLVDVNIAPTARSSSQILIDRVERNETLASLGAGSYRMLTIGAVLAATRKGIVTIDEIDTGLHYSRMADMWKMVIGAARDLDVQVFATTHSLDCLNSLEKALLKNPDLCQHVAVHRVERLINTAVTLDGHEFLRGMQRESEIR